jgi:hypothetical protein
MPFVPVMHQSEQPSMQAIELSQRLQQTIAEYQQRNPSLTAEEIRQAAELAARQTQGQSGLPKRAAVALVAAGAAVALGVGLWVSASPGGTSGAAMAPVAIIAAVAAVMVAIIRLRRN